MNKFKTFLVISLLFIVANVAYAVSSNFQASSNIIVSNVAFSQGEADLLIMEGSQAESFNYNSGIFSVTNPDSENLFKVGSLDSDAKAIRLLNSESELIDCVKNHNLGEDYISLPTDSGTYFLEPSDINLSNSLTYNSQCGAGSCVSGYRVSGNGSSAVCSRISTGGGGGGGGGTQTTDCSSVEYGPWEACVGTVQTRQVINRSPSGCTLTQSQQLDTTRDCIIDDDEEEVVDGDDPTEETGDEKESEDGDEEVVVVPPVVGESGGELKREVLRRERQEQGEVNLGLVERLNGRILLQVEEHGESWYVEPLDERRYYMGRPADAFSMMRRFGLGISEENFAKFEADGVPNRFSGRILLRVEESGEAYYINPVDMQMHYLGRPDDAFRIMRELGLGITNENLRQIPLGMSELDLVCLIENDLSFGMSSIEVLDLQRYLNSTDFPLALSGPGSKGRETNLFGSLTEETLKRYQAFNNINETGVFDGETRNSLSCF